MIDHLGAASKTTDTILAAVLHQRAEKLLRVLDRPVQFIADLAGHALA